MKNPVKKVLCTVTALVILLTSSIVFTGCGKNSSSESSSSKVETTEEETTESEYEEFVWPTGGLADKLPTPKSTTGEISSDNEDYINITVANTSYADFQQYVNDCKSMGFTVDYDNLGNTFYAKDSSGNDLSLYYDEDEKTMDIMLDAPYEEDTTAEKLKATKPKTKKKTTKKSSATSGVNADFKATMDSYEEFFNDYVDFMKKYENSDDVLSMASDYADYMTKYSDMISKLNAIKSEDLSEADLAYYTEVNARITKKLAEIN